MLATPDWRCSVASSRIPIVSVMPGRSVTSAASVMTSAEASTPSRTSRAAQKLAATAAIGATIGSVRAVRLVEIAMAPTRSPTSAAAPASRQPPPSTGVSAMPAIRIGGEHQGPGTVKRVVLDLRQRPERIVRVEPPVERVLDEAVEPGDCIQVDPDGRTRSA